MPLIAAEFKAAQEADRVTISLDGQLFTQYHIQSGSKPILWPIIGPTGQPMTRGYPMQDAGPSEKRDHIHHRSFWFTHGIVNDSDFWSEGHPNCGRTVHREFVKVSGGETAQIVTRNDWMDRAGQTICRDLRTHTFGVDGDARSIDFDIAITAGDEPVTFGDTKEGTFGVRVAGTMKVEAGQGGTIVNSDGQLNSSAWGKPAPWVDYYGPVAGETVGIAILNHPQSFRYPTYWHVRDYGLFAANVFGLHDFLGDNSVNAKHTLAPGETISFHYRVLLHRGNHRQAKIAEAFSRYAAEGR